MISNFTRIASAMAVLMHAGQTLAQTPPGFSPQTNNSVAVSYAGAAVGVGASVPLSDVNSTPSVQIPSEGSSHVVMMIDLDAPGGPTNNSLSPLLHWLVAVPSGISELPEQSDLTPIAPYSPPAPPEGSGPHRYVILVLEDPRPAFEMPPGFTDFDGSVIENRFGFDVSGFIEAGGFRLQGATWLNVERSNGTVPEAAASSTRTAFMSGILGVASVGTAIAACI